MPEATSARFIPSELMRLDASGEPPPRQWVSSETALL